MTTQTFNLRGTVFLPDSHYTIRRIPTRAEKGHDFQRRSIQVVALFPLGLLWLIIAGLMGGGISLFAEMPRIPGLIAGIATERVRRWLILLRVSVWQYLYSRFWYVY